MKTPHCRRYSEACFSNTYGILDLYFASLNTLYHYFETLQLQLRDVFKNTPFYLQEGFASLLKQPSAAQREVEHTVKKFFRRPDDSLGSIHPALQTQPETTIVTQPSALDPVNDDAIALKSNDVTISTAGENDDVSEDLDSGKHNHTVNKYVPSLPVPVVSSVHLLGSTKTL
jgi:hypothetical protein